ncbi:hypothetical protein HPP92_013744 [Vanilla planifolia]|uniref:C2H2-type domain-containing protein n=1 Tax=Vanilla planifolia TaxID=51239 RepID=A0A835UWZ1_VANPL|nr:hypothetical protein HPP92_013744 [Vanilla planifolia]
MASLAPPTNPLCRTPLAVARRFERTTKLVLHDAKPLVVPSAMRNSVSSFTADGLLDKTGWDNLDSDLFYWTRPLRPVQWYPGHIAKTEKELKEQLKLMDVVVEVRDARIPMSTSHPQMDSWLGNRKRIIVLNREDMISTSDRNAWALFFAKLGDRVVFSNGQLGMGTMKLGRLARSLAADVNVKRRAKGLLPRPVRAGIVGYPNVGKSSLINRLLKRRMCPAAPRPGVTREIKWVQFGKDLELLDSPGILPMRLSDQVAAVKLAICDDIGERSYDVTDVATILVQMLARLPSVGPEVLCQRYRIDADALCGKTFLDKLSLQLFNGDVGQASFRVLSDFRKGKLGWIALERPPKVPQDVASTGGKCSLLKWVNEDMLAALQEKMKEMEKQEAEPEPATEVLFLCSYEDCGKIFVDVGALKKHAHVHGERHYVCHFEGCGKKFLDSSKLRRHFLTHTGERAYVCPHEGCGKAFSLDFNLRAHMKTHSLENYHICPYEDCGKRYTHECKLKSHIKQFHEKNAAIDSIKHTSSDKQRSTPKPPPITYGSATSDRPYACPYEGCGKAYIHEYKLNLHLRKEHPGHILEENGKNNSTTDHNMDETSDQDAYVKKGSNTKNSKRSKPASQQMPPAKAAKRSSNLPPNNTAAKKPWPVKEDLEEDSEETEEDRENFHNDDDEETEDEE